MQTKEVNILEREKEFILKGLEDVQPQLDTDNMKVVAKKAGISLRTLRRYFNGEIGKKSVAEKIIEVARKNIIEREQKLSNHEA